MENCIICGEEIARASPIFYFPKFAPGHVLAKYFGTVHVQCLRNLPNSVDISNELREAYLNIFNVQSETPIVAHDGNLLVKDCIATRGCFEVFDFDDFVVFYIPEKDLLDLKSLSINESVSLGVQNLQRLSLRSDGVMELEIKRPAFTVDLSSVSFARLVHCLDNAELAIENAK